MSKRRNQKDKKTAKAAKEPKEEIIKMLDADGKPYVLLRLADSSIIQTKDRDGGIGLNSNMIPEMVTSTVTTMARVLNLPPQQRDSVMKETKD